MPHQDNSLKNPASSDNGALIRVGDLEKEYLDEGLITHVLEHVSFTIAAGEFVSIMGPSGSGKSTLMHILGLLDRPTGGIYEFEGRDVTGLSDEERAHTRNKKIGFVFQSFNLLARTSVLENIKLPLLYSAVPEEEWDKKAKSAAEAVGLSTRVAAKDGHPERLENSKYNGTSSYFTYTDDNGDLMPLSAESSSDFPDTPEESATFGEEDKDEVSTAVEHKIPIRVLEASSGIAQMGSKNPPMPQKLVPESWKPALSWATGALATVVIVLTIGYVSVSTNALYASMVPDSSSALVNRASDALSRIAEILESWIAPEVVYRRNN